MTQPASTIEFGGQTYPHNKLVSQTVPGEDVVYDETFLRQLQNGGVFGNSPVGLLCLVADDNQSFKFNNGCKCKHPITEEIGIHTQYWAVLQAEDGKWLSRRTS